MAAKRKKNQDQPELPIPEVPDITPGEVHAAPVPPEGNGKAPKDSKNGDGNGEGLRRRGGQPAVSLRSKWYVCWGVGRSSARRF